VREITTALARLAHQSGLSELAFFLEMSAIVAGEHAQQQGS
jgi:hypothetical protein